MSSEQPKKRSSRVIALVIIAAVLLGTFIITRLDSFNGSSEDGKANGTPPATQQGPPLTTVAAHIATETVLRDRITVAGTVIPNEEVLLVSEVSGKIEAILFNEGQSVKAGTPLVQINDSELQAQLVRTKLREELAAISEKRIRELLEKKASAQADYDVVQNELQVAKAEIALLETQIAKTVIKAPFDGVVGLRQVSKGSYITPAAPIATIRNINPVKIDFAVPEKYAASLTTGSVIEFSIQGSSAMYNGKVYAIEPRIDDATRTLKARAIAQNNSGTVKPGAFAEISFPLKTIENAVMIPTQAIVPVLQGKQVFLYKNGKAESHPIITGTRTDDAIQVIEGIATGDTVIISGLLQIRDGAGVAIGDIR